MLDGAVIEIHRRYQRGQLASALSVRVGVEVQAGEVPAAPAGTSDPLGRSEVEGLTRRRPWVPLFVEDMELDAASLDLENRVCLNPTHVVPEFLR